MNTCLICGKIQDAELPTCVACGEASFRFGPQVAPAQPVVIPSVPDEETGSEDPEPANTPRRRRK